MQRQVKDDYKNILQHGGGEVAPLATYTINMHSRHKGEAKWSSRGLRTEGIVLWDIIVVFPLMVGKAGNTG